MPITAAGQQAVKDGEMGLIRWRVKMSMYDADGTHVTPSRSDEQIFGVNGQILGRDQSD
jgi:hypothetical protein